MKKRLSLFLAVLMALSLLTACGKQAEEVAEPATQLLALGTSAYSITADASFQKGELSAEDTDESQVAYYFSEKTTVDFDVYQWVKATGETLASTAAAEAEEYDNAEVSETEFNGISVLAYNAVEEYDGEDYPTVTYLMEDGDNIVELVFWLDGDSAQAEVDAIMATLSK